METDIVEYRFLDGAGRDVQNIASFNLHWDGYGPEHKNAGSQWGSSSSLDGTWHTYAYLWTPELNVFYVDEIERWRTKTVISHAPQEIRLTCEIKEQGWAGKIPDHGYGSNKKSTFGMDVDWVRVWKELK